jgi:hypothetical protein
MSGLGTCAASRSETTNRHCRPDKLGTVPKQNPYFQDLSIIA